MYIGGSSYRFQGPGDPYLRSKSIYIAPNPWDLGRSLAIYMLIAGIGYFISSLGGIWLGYGLMIASTYFALGEIKENWDENHLKKALERLTPLETLPCIPWEHSPETHKITINPKNMTESAMRGVDEHNRTQLVLYKIPSRSGLSIKHTIKIYYLGTDLFVRSSEINQDIRLEYNNLLRGKDIQRIKGQDN